MSNAHSNSVLSKSAPIIAILALIAAVAIGVAVYLTRSPPVSSESAAGERPFKASDFKWPTLIEHLNDGSMSGAINTEEAVFVLYYLKEMNEVFGDPDMKVFIDAKCFTEVFDSEMSARLQSVFWTKILPNALWELGSLVKDERSFPDAVAARYPILSGVVSDITKEVPNGTLDRLFILGNLPHILQAKARQDALTLLSGYGCGNIVTRRIYANAVAFVKAYNLKASQ